MFAAGSGTRLYENTKFFNGKGSRNFGVFVKSPLWLRSCRSRSCLPVPEGLRRAQVCSAGHPNTRKSRRKAHLARVFGGRVPEKRRLSLGLTSHRPAGGPGPCRSSTPTFRAFLCPNPPKSLDLGDP